MLSFVHAVSTAVPNVFVWHDFLFLSLKSPFMAAMQ